MPTSRRVSPEQPLRVAVVGCGAIAQHAHLPALGDRTDVEIATLVDVDHGRLRTAGDQFPRAAQVQDHQAPEVVQADAAILTVPNHLHARLAIDLLLSGLHVLVEKPMARSQSECGQMIRAATDAGVLLAVALVYRFSRSARMTKHILDSGIIKDVSDVEFRIGRGAGWPVHNPRGFDPALSGGGTLLDLGPHALDLLSWWFGSIRPIDYFDDASGGIETDCELRLSVGPDIPATVHLSRRRNLGAEAIIRGANFTLRANLRDDTITLHNESTNLELGGRVESLPDASPPATLAALTQAVHNDFFRVLEASWIPQGSAEVGLEIAVAIDASYSKRQELYLPWEATTSAIESE